MPGAGRPVGVLNRTTVAQQAEAAKTGPLPGAGLLYTFRRWLKRVAALEKLQTSTDAAVSPELEHALDKMLAAAKDAAPYFHHRLSALSIDANVSHTFDLSGLSDNELEQFERLRRKIDSQPAGHPGGEDATQH